MEVSSLSLHRLKVFAIAGHGGSFTMAAEALMLSEPTVSEHIKVLERQVGVKLFDRPSGRRIRLTEAGRRLLVTCDSIFDLLKTTMGEIEALSRIDAGSVVVGGGRLVCGLLYPQIYPTFRQIAPMIALRVHGGSQNDLIDGVLHRRLDVAVTLYPVDNPRLTSVRLASWDMVLIGPKGHRLAGYTDAPFSELASEPFVILHMTSLGTAELVRQALKSDMPVNVALEVGNVEAQVSAVASGMGIGAVPFYAVRSHVSAGEVCLLRVRGFPKRFDFFVVSLAGEQPAPVVAFTQHLLDHVPTLEAMTLCTPPPGSLSG